MIAALLPLAFGQDAKKDPDQIGTRDVSKGINFYSIEKEMALGKQLALEVEKHSKLLTDKTITEYVNRIGQNLARHSDTRIPLTVKVIEGDDPNAVTLPGGYIYVQTELLRTADTEAELAAAMAHPPGDPIASDANRDDPADFSGRLGRAVRPGSRQHPGAAWLARGAAEQ
jgi:predicted Zn-dependent protease